MQILAFNFVDVYTLLSHISIVAKQPELMSTHSKGKHNRNNIAY